MPAARGAPIRASPPSSPVGEKTKGSDGQEDDGGGFGNDHEVVKNHVDHRRLVRARRHVVHLGHVVPERLIRHYRRAVDGNTESVRNPAEIDGHVVPHGRVPSQRSLQLQVDLVELLNRHPQQIGGPVIEVPI